MILFQLKSVMGINCVTLFLLVGVLVGQSFAARSVGVKEKMTIAARSVRNTGSSDVKEQLHLSKNTDLKEVDSIMTAQGTVVHKFEETYRGIPVYNTLVDIEDILEGESIAINGDLYGELEEDLEDQMECNITEDKAVDIALSYFGMNGVVVDDKHFSDIIYINDDGYAVLSIQVDLSLVATDHSVHRPLTWIGKCNGTVLEQYDQTGFANVRRDVSNSTEGPTGSEGSTEATDGPTSDTDGTSDGTNGLTGSTDGPMGDTDVPTNATSSRTRGTNGSAGGARRRYRQLKNSRRLPRRKQRCDLKGLAGNKKRKFKFGRKHCVELSRDGDVCTLENDFIKGVDLKSTWNGRKTEVVSFQCDQGYSTPINGGFAPMLEAFYYGTKSATMYTDWYNYQAIKEKLYVKAHYGVNYENAFFSGNTLGFGDGDGVSTYPWTNLDTVAHEYAHGVIDRSSKLAYKEQSGGMNEAFCDMAGEVAEQYVFGDYDMLIGWDLFLDKKTSLRFFDEPVRDGFSIMHVDDFRKKMSVHASSGVYNHVFYLMEKAMGVRNAFECFLTATRLYWKASTDFEEGACGTIRGAYDGGLDMDVVAASFKAVGITFHKCPDMEDFVIAELVPDKKRENLHISKDRNPLFKVDVSNRANAKMVVEVSGGFEITISKSYKRTEEPLLSGKRRVKVKVPKKVNTLYVRIHTSKEKKKTDNGSISFVFK